MDALVAFRWGLRGIPPGIERRVRVFIHFSRTFKPKQNKEGIDDHAALQRYREICSDGHQRGIRQKIEGFLTECHSNDCKVRKKFHRGGARQFELMNSLFHTVGIDLG